MSINRFLTPRSPQEHLAAALEQRTDPAMRNLIVPSWVMKDEAFSKQVRSKGFHSQRGLDNFISREAERRRKQIVRFNHRQERQHLHDTDRSGCILPKADCRRVPKAELIERIRERERRSA